MRSFDAARERPAPSSFAGVTLDGNAVTHTFEGRTLVVAVKTMCDGCRDFVNSTLDELDNVTVLIVSGTDDPDGEWVNARQQVLVAPELLKELDIKWPPFYVLVDGLRRQVVSEGVVFGPSQVALEIAPYLTARDVTGPHQS